MATQPKVNPTLPNVARHFNGKSITGVTIATGAVMTDEFGANGALQDIYEVMAENATPIIVSQVRTPGTTSAEFDVYFEGDFLEVDDYGTSNDASFVADLQVRIRALGATAAVRDAVTAAASGETESAGVDLAGATATAITAIVDDTTGTAGLVGDGGVDIS